MPNKHIHEHSEKCSGIECGPQSQLSFCVELTFNQELVSAGQGATAGALVPLSSVSQNVDGIKGTLKLKFNSDLSIAAYKLYVFNAKNSLNQITAAHLHFGAAGRNGPVVVPLFIGPQRNVNGLLAEGKIYNRNISNITVQGVPQFNNLASVYSSILDGNIYANVHSTAHPDGVIRGQLYAH